MRDEGEQLLHKKWGVKGQLDWKERGGRLTCSSQSVFDDNLALEWRPASFVWCFENQLTGRWGTQEDQKIQQAEDTKWHWVQITEC